MPASRISWDGSFGSLIMLYLPDGITQVRAAIRPMIANKTAKADTFLVWGVFCFGCFFTFWGFATIYVLSYKFGLYESSIALMLKKKQGVCFFFIVENWNQSKELDPWLLQWCKPGFPLDQRRRYSDCRRLRRRLPWHQGRIVREFPYQSWCFYRGRLASSARK